MEKFVRQHAANLQKEDIQGFRFVYSIFTLLRH